MALETPPAQATNGALVRWAFERLNARDLDALAGFWTEETAERFPDRMCHGSEEIAAYFREAFAALPDDWGIEVVALAESGEDVLVRWRLEGTHNGAWHGIEPTGRRIAIDGIDHFVIRDGVVASNFVVYDQMQFARQIGLLPPDGSGADRALRRAFNVRTALVRRLLHR